MATGIEYREEDVSDVPDEQFQRGLIFGTEAVSAEASRDNWSAFVEFSVPVLESLEVNVAAALRRLQRLRRHLQPEDLRALGAARSLAFRASWGTGFRAPSLAQIGLGPSQESQFFVDTSAAPTTRPTAPATDYNIVFAGNPDLEAEESENFNIGVAWKPTDSWLFAVDYWDIKQENKIDEVNFGYLFQQFCGVQDSDVCVRGTPLPGDTLGPAAVGQLELHQHRRADDQRRGRERALPRLGHGRRAVRRPGLLADAGIQEARTERGRHELRHA